MTTNTANKELLEGKHVDFRSAVVALKIACLHELMEVGTASDDTVRKVFQRSIEDCDKAIEIYDKLYPEFKAKLVCQLQMFQLYDFLVALETDNYILLGF